MHTRIYFCFFCLSFFLCSCYYRDEPTDAIIIDDTEETSVPIASAKAQISGRKKLGTKKSFSKLKDDATGNFYYHDIETDEVVWYVVKKKRQLGDTI